MSGEVGKAEAVTDNDDLRMEVLRGALRQAKTATLMVIDKAAGLPLKDL